MTRDIDSARAAFQTAVTALRSGDAAMAERAARAALQEHPGNANFLTVLGAALNRQGRGAEAENVLRTAIDFDPAYAKAHEALAHSLLASGRTAEAIEALRDALIANPALESAQLTLSQALLADGHNDEAKATFDAFLRRQPQRQRLAEAAEHHRLRRFEQAEAIYRELLREDRDNVTLLRMYGLLAIDAGHYRNAVLLLRRAVKRAPDFRAAWIELSRAQTEMHELDDAAASAHRAIELDPERAGGHIALANAFARSSRADEAVAAYQRANAIRPDNPEPFLGLGNILKTVGRQHEAIIAYREGLRLRPDYAELYWSLSNLKTFRFAPEEVCTMERALESEGLPNNAIVHFCFALGKAREDDGDYAGAFRHFERGNSLRRAEEHYDPVSTERLGERIRKVFSPDFVRLHAGGGFAGVAPVFIVGLPRSGSTLIEQILASHGQVEATQELPEGGRLVRFIDRQRIGGCTYPEAVEHFSTQAFFELGQRYDRETRRYRSGSPRFIDKMPNNFALIGLLQLAMPNARFINARRDPRDTCLSCYKQLFARGQSFTYDLMELGDYYLEYQRMMDHWHRVLPGRVLDVRYEDVVADLETQTRRMLEFCGLTWDDACLRFHTTERAVRTASSEQVRRPIYGDAVAFWRNYEGELRPLIDVLAPVLAACSVEATAVPPP